jgi:rhodanese-related sulfurtransferase
VTLIDVRRTTDYATLPDLIPDAFWRDPEKIENWINELDADNPTVVYCVKGGSVSQLVTDRPRREELDALYLEGGLKAWTEDGQSVVTDQSRQQQYTIRHLNYHREIQGLMHR